MAAVMARSPWAACLGSSNAAGGAASGASAARARDRACSSSCLAWIIARFYGWGVKGRAGRRGARAGVDDIEVGNLARERRDVADVGALELFAAVGRDIEREIGDSFFAAAGRHDDVAVARLLGRLFCVLRHGRGGIQDGRQGHHATGRTEDCLATARRERVLLDHRYSPSIDASISSRLRSVTP